MEEQIILLLTNDRFCYQYDKENINIDNIYNDLIQYLDYVDFFDKDVDIPKLVEIYSSKAETNILSLNNKDYILYDYELTNRLAQINKILIGGPLTDENIDSLLTIIGHKLNYRGNSFHASQALFSRSHSPSLYLDRGLESFSYKNSLTFPSIFVSPLLDKDKSTNYICRFVLLHELAHYFIKKDLITNFKSFEDICNFIDLDKTSTAEYKAYFDKLLTSHEFYEDKGFLEEISCDFFSIICLVKYYVHHKGNSSISSLLNLFRTITKGLVIFDFIDNLSSNFDKIDHFDHTELHKLMDLVKCRERVISDAIEFFFLYEGGSFQTESEQKDFLEEDKRVLDCNFDLTIELIVSMFNDLKSFKDKNKESLLHVDLEYLDVAVNYYDSFDHNKSDRFRTFLEKEKAFCDLQKINGRFSNENLHLLNKELSDHIFLAALKHKFIFPTLKF